MNYVSHIDYFIVSFYFLFMLAIGIYFKNRASESIDDYFLGGRKLPWWALGFTGMGYYVNISGTLIIIAFVYMLGPRGMYIEFRGGVCLVMAFMLLWTGKWHRRSGCMTLAEWMIFRFGKGIGAQFSRIFQVVAIVSLTIGMLSLTIKALGIFLSTFIPLSPMVCSIIFVGIAALYTTMSGFYGVVATDVIQGIMVLIGAIMCTIIAMNKGFSVGQLSEIASQVTGNINWTASLPKTGVKMAPGFEQYSNLLSFAVSYLFLNVLLGMGISGTEPIYFAAKNDRACGTLSFVWIFTMTFRWLLIMAFAVFGVLLVKDLFPDNSVLSRATELITQYTDNVPQSQWGTLLSKISLQPEAFPVDLISGLKNLLGDNWAEKIKMISFHGDINPETVMPMVLCWSIPSGLRGIILICLIAAAMSTIDMTLNRASGYFVNDVYKSYIRPKATNKELITASYSFTVLLVIAGFAMAYSLKSVNEIWGWMVMSLSAGLVAPAMLRLYWWRFSGSAFAIGTGVGILSAVMQRIFIPGMDERVQMIFVLGIASTFSIIASFIFRPVPADVLENFYRKTKPFGFWGPLKKRLSLEIQKKMNTEHRNDIIAVPFVIGWQITMFLMAMQFVIKVWLSLFITMAINFIMISGMYWFWYRNLPKENFWEDDESKLHPPQENEKLESTVTQK